MYSRVVRHGSLCQRLKDFFMGFGRNKFLGTSIGILFFIYSPLFVLNGFSQKKALNYQIIRNGDQVGSLRFWQATSGATDSLKMESDVKTRFVFSFVAQAREYAIFNNGVLMQSSIYRKLNKSEKANKQHRVNNSQYTVYQGSGSRIIKTYPITYNMLSLYSREPVNIGKVYSDNFETFLNIQKLETHRYKVMLPDGSYNFYSYTNGILSLIEIHHRLYSAKIVLLSTSGSPVFY